MNLEIWKQIKRKQFAPIYLLFGQESFLINETKHLLIKHAINEGEEDFNLSSYDLEETPIEVALEDAETFPFLGEKRIVLIHNPGFLTTEKTKEKLVHNIGKLEEYLKHPAPYTILVLIAPYEKLDERKKITKEIKKTASIFEAKKLNEQELRLWVKERAKLNNVELEEDAIELMLVLVGTNLFMLTSEVDKLSLYANDTKIINKEIVEKLVSRSLEQNIFTLVEKIMHRKIEDALRIYYDLLKQNEEPIKILSIISGQMRLLYQVKELSRRGYGQQQIAGYLKIHPFRVKLAAGQAQKFSDEELIKAIKLLADADHQLKTGGMNKAMLIEMFLFRMQESI